MENKRIAGMLEEVADLLELKGKNQFRVRSYRDAAREIKEYPKKMEKLIEEGDDLTSLPGIGKSMAEKIRTIVQSGELPQLKKLRKEMPSGVTEIMNVPSVGPRTAKQLYDELKVTSLNELKKACKEGKVRNLSGLGEKSEQKILEGIETVGPTKGRFLLNEAKEYVETIGAYLNGLKDVKEWSIAGSYRRGKETIGDLDILIHAEDRKQVGEDILSFKEIEKVIEKGKERISVLLKDGPQVDFRFFEDESMGSAILYFTGSKDHNIILRKKAQEKDWKLNEYGLFSGKKRLAGSTEESVYQRFGMDWIPPELRENRGEGEAAQDGTLPRLVERENIKGDLHVHTKASDGQNTLEELVEGARKRGLHYLAITDHSKAVAVAQGLDDEGTLAHADEVREYNETLQNFRLFTGIEVDILKNGGLDLEEKTLSSLDWVVASVHSHFRLGKKEMTERLLTAVQSGVVKAVGHPLGRMFGQRPEIELDLERIFHACAEHGVALEINCSPSRLDLPDRYCKQAAEAGVKMVVATDAHKVEEFDLLQFGVLTARRGWLTAADIINTGNSGDIL